MKSINGYFREGKIKDNKLVKIKFRGNILIYNVEFFIHEHNREIKNLAHFL